jgi:hypothetical protein
MTLLIYTLVSAWGTTIYGHRADGGLHWWVYAYAIAWLLTDVGLVHLVVRQSIEQKPREGVE